MTAQELVRWIQANLKEDQKVFIEYDGTLEELDPEVHLKTRDIYDAGVYWTDDPSSASNRSIGEHLVILSQPYEA